MKRVLSLFLLVALVAVIFKVFTTTEPDEALPEKEQERRDLGPAQQEKPDTKAQTNRARTLDNMADESCYLQGKVVDIFDDPVENALITAEDQSVKSDQNGSFLMAFPGPRQGIELKVNLQTSYSGYASDVRRVALGSATHPGLVTIRLSSGIHMEGVVVDESHKPISGAKIELERINSINDRRLKGGEVFSDKDGNFSIADFPPKHGGLFVSAEGFKSHRMEPDLSESGLVVLTLTRLQQIYGVVVDRDTQRPLSDCVVELESEIGPERTVCEGGRFQMNYDGSLVKSVQFKAPGYIPAVYTISELPENPLQIALEREPQELRGTVYFPDGRHAAGARVVLAPYSGGLADWSLLDQPEGDAQRVLTNSQGAFRLDRIVTGQRYYLMYDAPNMAQSTIHVPRINLEEDVPLDLYLKAPGSISGSMDFNAWPRAQAVVITPGDNAWVEQIPVSETEPHFKLNNLPPGSYRVSLMNDVFYEEIQLHSGEDRIIHFGKPSGTLKGRILQGGQPLAGGTVFMNRYKRLATTNGKGYFQFDAVPFQTHSFQVLPVPLPEDAIIGGVQSVETFFQWHEPGFTIDHRDGVEDYGDFEIPREGDLRGYWPNGEAGMVLKLIEARHMAHDAKVRTAWARLREDLTFEFKELPPDNYSLFIANQGEADRYLAGTFRKNPGEDLDIGDIGGGEYGSVVVRLEGEVKGQYSGTASEAESSNLIGQAFAQDGEDLVWHQLPPGPVDLTFDMGKAFQAVDRRIPAMVKAGETSYYTLAVRKTTYLSMLLENLVEGAVFSREGSDLTFTSRDLYLWEIFFSDRIAIFVQENEIVARNLPEGSWNMDITYTDQTTERRTVELVAGEVISIYPSESQ